MLATSAYCTFTVDGHHFGVEVLRIQEVMRQHQMTPVPRSSPVVRGLMNLRGQIVTALDLRMRLGLPASEPDRKLMNVVIRTDDGPVSLLVDDIGDVLELESNRFELPPDTLRGLPRELIKGVYKLETKLLMILALEPALRISA